MSRLNKTQIYAINWLHGLNKSAEDIAEDLDLNLDQVTKALEKASSNQKSKNIKTGSEPANLMINKTAGKGNSGVTIMTKEASEKNDALRANTNRETLHKAIYRPKK
jgi:hypothetical protein